jgi:hypothetical protein
MIIATHPGQTCRFVSSKEGAVRVLKRPSLAEARSREAYFRLMTIEPEKVVRSSTALPLP